MTSPLYDDDPVTDDASDGALSTGIREAKRLLRAPAVQISAG